MTALEQFERTHDDPEAQQLAREMADLCYVVFGTAWVCNIDLDAAFKEVHRANMSKMDAGLRREDGKIIKPPGFVSPDMRKAVKWQ
jgi:predicted HAD superfamily Cof-like phosphohydrolase